MKIDNLTAAGILISGRIILPDIRPVGYPVHHYTAGVTDVNTIRQWNCGTIADRNFHSAKCAPSSDRIGRRSSAVSAGLPLVLPERIT